MKDIKPILVQFIKSMNDTIHSLKAFTIEVEKLYEELEDDYR